MPTWETAADWDAATSETGTMHADLANTDFNDASTLNHAIPVGNTDANVRGQLIGHYPLQGSSNTTAFNFAGTTDGTVIGGTPQATGLLGTTAFDFDGTDDRIDTNLTANIGSAFSLSAFINADTIQDGDDETVIGVIDDLTVARMGTQGFGSKFGVTLRNQDRDVVRAEEPVDNVPNNQFIHVCVVFNGNSLSYHRDGVEIDSTPSSISPSTPNNWHVGDRSDGNTPFDGRIADARIYERALSLSEIQTLNESVRGTATLTSASKSL